MQAGRMQKSISIFNAHTHTPTQPYGLCVHEVAVREYERAGRVAAAGRMRPDGGRWKKPPPTRQNQ